MSAQHHLKLVIPEMDCSHPSLAPRYFHILSSHTRCHMLSAPWQLDGYIYKAGPQNDSQIDTHTHTHVGESYDLWGI